MLLRKNLGNIHEPIIPKVEKLSLNRTLQMLNDLNKLENIKESKFEQFKKAETVATSEKIKDPKILEKIKQLKKEFPFLSNQDIMINLQKHPEFFEELRSDKFFRGLIEELSEKDIKKFKD